MIWFLLIWSLSSLGFIALASSMSKHQKQIFGYELNTQKTRIALVIGWSCLILSLIACIWQSNISIGMSYWIGALTLAALVVASALTYLANKMKILALGCMIILIISILLEFLL